MEASGPCMGGLPTWGTAGQPDSLALLYLLSQSLQPSVSEMCSHEVTVIFSQEFIPWILIENPLCARYC